MKKTEVKSKKQRPDLERIKQNIFSAKTEKEKKMWMNILKKLESNHE